MKQVPLLESALSKVGTNDPTLKQFVYALGAQESGYNPTAVGPSTKSGDKAQGMLQVMPATFRGLQKQYPGLLKDMKNPEDLAIAGVLYAQEALKFAKNDPKIAGAYFYGGPSGARKALKGIAVSDPKNKGFPNTLEYGNKIAQRMGSSNWRPDTSVVAASTPVVGTQVPQQAMNAPTPVNAPKDMPPLQLYSSQVNDRLAELNKLLGSVPQQQQPVEQGVTEQPVANAPSNFMNMFGFNQQPTVSELRSFGLF
jgi:SLT domain-containing protein